MKFQKAWFFPQINLGDYIRKYPAVFAFSLLSAFFAPLQFLAHVFMAQQVDIPIQGFDSLNLALEYGIPLFAFLHLLLQSPWLKKFHYHSVFYTLGAAILYALFYHFSNSDADNKQFMFSHLFLCAALGAFLIPLLARRPSVYGQWEYLCDFLLTLAAVYLMGSLTDLIFQKFNLLASIPYIGYFAPNGTFPDGPVGYLLIPWYLLGPLDRALFHPAPGTQALEIGPKVLWGSMGLVLIAFLIAYMTGLLWWVNGFKDAPDYASSLIWPCLLALISFLAMVPIRVRKAESWMWDYKRSMALGAFPLLAGAAWLSIRAENFGEPGDYDFLYLLAWLAIFFAYAFLRPQKDLKLPLVSLAVLLFFASIGPFGSNELSFRHHRTELRGLLIQAGMFQNGKFAKSETDLASDQLNKIETQFQTIASNFGLSRLQPWFDLDLRGLERPDETGMDNGWRDAMVLLQTLGLKQCDTLVANGDPKVFSAKRGVLDVSGYDQEQPIDVLPGCPNPSSRDRDQFLVSLSDQNTLLTMQHQGSFLGDIPLEKISQIMKAKDYSDMFRANIPQEDLSVEYENNKVKAKIYFSHIEAFKTNNELRIQSASGFLLIHLK